LGHEKPATGPFSILRTVVNAKTSQDAHSADSLRLTRRRFLRTTLLGAGAAVAGLSLANLDLCPFNPKKVEAAESGAGWNLQITNPAGSTVSYTLDQLLAMPATTVGTILWCDEWQVAAGDWRGVSLGYLLQGAGLDPKVTLVSFRAEDGYEVSIQLSDAMDPSVIVAYENNGLSLPEGLRLVVPLG
jgi:DMSO/TMAO reductase YedYZ molybdopterin-dependent catalytic subunit